MAMRRGEVSVKCVVDQQLKRDFSSTGVNLETYPIDRPGSKEYDVLIEKSRQDLKRTGCATFEDFWNKDVVEQAVNHISKNVSTAFETDNERTCIDNLFFTGPFTLFPLDTQTTRISCPEKMMISPTRIPEMFL